MRALTLVAILVVAGCTTGTAQPSLPSSTPVGSPQPLVTASHQSPTPTASAASTPTTRPEVLPGEPWILFHWAYPQDGVAGHGTFMVRPDGRDKHLVLAAPAGFPDWSPDGKRIAVEAEPADSVPEIWTLGADGTGVMVVTCDGAPCGDVARPAWSPDGGRLAFQRAIPREPGEQYDRIAIDVLDLATGATRVVARTPVAGSQYVEYVAPRWSPDGRQIVFALASYPTPPTDENILGSSIAVVMADGSEVDAPRVLTDPALFAAAPDWSPDGQHIVFNTYPIANFQDTTKASNLYTIKPDGTKLTQVTHYGENDTRATLPTWTPDGKQIIFTDIARNPSDPWGDRRIALIDANGANLTLIPVPADAGVPGPWWFGAYARMRPTP